MNTYEEFQWIKIQEYRDYCTAIEILEKQEILSEGLLDTLSSGVKEKLSFIKSLAQYGKMKLDDILKIFKDSRVYKFFSAIKFNLTTLWQYIKAGFKAYSDLQRAIAEYIANTKVVKWTTQALAGLDTFLMRHPNIKRLGGFAVAGLLIFIWLNMSFTGDFSYDFDFSEILLAIGGTYSMSSLFGGTDGTRLLMLFATGLAGLSFPWPGPTHVKFVTALINGLKKLVA